MRGAAAMLSATRTGGRKCITSFRATSSMAKRYWVKTVVKLSHLLALGLALLFGTGSNAQDPISATNGFVPSTAANRSVKRGVEVQIKDLNPFTHFALIPATSNAQTIKLERVKATRLYTKLKSTMDPGYCGDLQFRDPGGSMYCPYTHYQSPAPAYEVTYSFTGQPLASDEYNNRYFTFWVYFRPEEMDPTVRTALSAGKMRRTELASYFKVTTSRQPFRGSIIDMANSDFCQTNHPWLHHDPKCQDKIIYKTVTMLPDSITVQVNAVSPQPK
ncbi:MAG TPA: hypothetical protein VNX70_18915 [Bryobacteraceae bacterium]|nr:hypothetical protein [Bryobacteraceae bacterium]